MIDFSFSDPGLPHPVDISSRNAASEAKDEI